MRKSGFYFAITGLIVLNGFLLSKPNLLGKIGLIVYRYYYLRSFPRALLTVALVCAAAVGLMELFSFLVRRRIIGRTMGVLMFGVFVTLGFAQLIKTGIDFSVWTYSHTGLRFRLGAFMLPTIVIVIFAYGWLRLPRHTNLYAVDESDPRRKESNPILK